MNKKVDKICTINGIDFFYGGWNENGWHLVFTNLENFHVGDNFLQLPTERDCQRIYRNYYEQKKVEIRVSYGKGERANEKIYRCC